MNNELFADDSPMVEGSVEPTRNDDMFAAPTGSGAPSQSSPFQAQGGFDDFTAAPAAPAASAALQQQGFGDADGFGNDFAAAPQTGFTQSQTSPKNDFTNDFVPAAQSQTSPKNDFGGEFVASQTQQQSASQGSNFGSATEIPAPVSATAAVTDEALSSPVAAVPAPIVTSSSPVASPGAAVASPIGSQRNLAASRSSSSVLPATTAPSQAFLERGKAKLEAQLRAVQERVAAADVNTKKKEQEIQAKASTFLGEANKKRDAQIAVAKADHLKDQQQYEAKMSQFKKSGAVWNSVNLLVDTTKPNPYSKNTEHMRKLIGELQQQS